MKTGNIKTGKLIKDLLREKGLIQKDLAEYLKENPVNITRWITGMRRIPDNAYPKIATFLGVNIDTLMNNDSGVTKVNFVPIVGTASCGATEYNLNQETKRKASYNGDTWKASLYCIIANGDSMSPEIDDGDEVIVDPDIKVINGDMVHYRIDDESAIKVLFIDEDAHIMQFIPYNSNDVFKIKTIRLDDEETMEKLKVHKVISVNKLKFNNRASRLRMIGR